jgi:predicted Zn-dependent protease
MIPAPLCRLSCFLLALLLVGLPQLRAENIALPDIGASAGSLLTPAEEERIGRQFMRSVRRSLPVMDDPLLVDYIESLGQRLASKLDGERRNFHFFLVDQPVVNAFAGPAGHIGVYSGLILATESESELASVLAHEIAHVSQHHLVRAFENANQLSGPLAALLIAAVVLGSQVSGDVGVAAAAGVQAAAIQQQINFTRENEQEADRVGIQILSESDFDPHAMPVFFERLAKSSRLYENNAPEFLRTHPVTTNRIADALGRADKYPYRQVPESAGYFLVRAVLRENAFANPREAVSHFEGTLRQGRYRDQDAERYGYALALLRTHQGKKARVESRKLLAKSPTNVAYLLLDARVDAELGQTDRALKNLAAALELFPGNYPLTSVYAELSLARGRGAQTTDALDRAIEERPEEPRLYRLRSQAAAAAGNKGEAYLFLAEAHHLSGQLENAVQQLEAALRTEKLDFYLSSRLQAKLEALKREQELEKEAKKRQ